MKKWEEERKKKQFASKINNAKPTLSTQPKGSRVNRTPALSGQYNPSQYGGPLQGTEMGDRPFFPSRGRAEFQSDEQTFEDTNGYQGMFNIPTHEILDERSPVINMNNNLNYKHMTGMNATQYTNQLKQRQGSEVAYHNPNDFTGKIMATSKIVRDS